MYSPKIITHKLNLIQNQINLRPIQKQFSLKIHSVDEIQFYNNHLWNLVEGEYKPGKPKSWKWKRELKQDEINFIENERFICQNYFRYYATRYAYIDSTLTNDNSVITLCNPTFPQNIIIDIWAEAEENFFAILELILKARQLGISTLVEIEIARRIQYYTNQNALIASSDPDKTRKLAAKIKLCWDKQPPWMIGEYNLAVSKELWAEFPQQNNGITVQHGTAKAGVARGDTPKIFHLTEVIEWNDPDEDIDAALLNAIHEHPAIFGIIETTGNGDNNKSASWLKEKWKYCIENYHKGISRLKPVFIPYYVGTDVWPTKTWVRQVAQYIDIENWKPKELTKKHAEQAQHYVANTAYLRKHLGRSWKLSKIQQLWWEITRNEFEKKDKLHKFYQELASNPKESFLRGGKGVISVDQIIKLRTYAKPLANYYGKPAVFAIVGDGIPLDQEPSMEEIDSSRPFITIKSDWSSEEAKTFRLIPLEHDPEIWQNRLFIWEFPFKDQNPNTEYSTGIDCAEGLEGEGDNSVIEVVRKLTLENPAEQVAEFCSDSFSASELLPFALAIGSFYSLNTPNHINQCKQAIETKFGGVDLQKQLMLAGWSNFHRWHGAYDNIKRKSFNKIGWDTNSLTRPMLISNVIKAIKQGYFKINSQYFLDEILNLVKNEDSSRIEAKGKNKDDRFFAGGIAFFSLHDWELYLLNKGDENIVAMFSSYGKDSKEIIYHPTLAETINQVEENMLQTSGNSCIIADVLPTL